MTQNTEAIAQLPQSGERDYLTLQEIADFCGVSYKTVRQYADVDAVRQFMGGYYHPSSKGARYPLDSDPKWRALMDAASKRLVTPATSAAWLTNLEVKPSIAQLPQSGENALALTPIQAIAQLPSMGDEAIALLRQLVNNVVSNPEQVVVLNKVALALERHSDLLERLPLPDDCLLDAREAGKILSCAPATVRRHVKPVLRGRWRRSDLLRWMQQLGSN